MEECEILYREILLNLLHNAEGAHVLLHNAEGAHVAGPEQEIAGDGNLPVVRGAVAAGTLVQIEELRDFIWSKGLRAYQNAQDNERGFKTYIGPPEYVRFLGFMNDQDRHAYFLNMIRKTAVYFSPIGTYDQEILGLLEAKCHNVGVEAFVPNDFTNEELRILNQFYRQIRQIAAQSPAGFEDD